MCRPSVIIYIYIYLCVLVLSCQCAVIAMLYYLYICHILCCRTPFFSSTSNTDFINTSYNYPSELLFVKCSSTTMAPTGDLLDSLLSLLSGDLTICPRAVSLKSSGATVRLPVRVIEISPKSVLCSLTGVNVVDSLTPDLSQMEETKSTRTSLEDLGVTIDTDNLTADQLRTT